LPEGLSPIEIKQREIEASLFVITSLFTVLQNLRPVENQLCSESVRNAIAEEFDNACHSVAELGAGFANTTFELLEELIELIPEKN